MKVLLAHKFFYTVGGTEIYFQNLTDILHSHGHETIPFALSDPRNPPSPYAQYFLSPLDLRNSGPLYKLRNVGKIVARSLYSFEARRKIGELIAKVRPDVAHLQAIENHISPSIVHELRKRGVPSVQSVNMYKHVCASYRLYIDAHQQVCDRCRHGQHYNVLLTRCVKNSTAASALGMLEMYLHQSLMRIYDGIDRFIVANEFMRQRMLEAGYAADKLVLLRNPLPLDNATPVPGMATHVLYFGRIEPEKGVMTLLRAMRHIPAIKLVVVGDGTSLAACMQWQQQHGGGNVEFVGPKWGDELRPYLQNCSLVVVPSEWYEPSPYVIYQALAAGKAVVGTQMGGIPDLVTPETGVVVPPGQPEALARAMEEIAGNPERARGMGRAARRWAEEHLSPAHYYRHIEHLYRELIERR